jgi:arsenite methyltransferase
MKHFTESQYDLDSPEIVSILDDLPLWSAPFGLKLLDVIQFQPQINVLDVGSGNGFPLIEISQRLGHTCRVFGIDPWRSAVERTNSKIKEWQISNLTMIYGKAENLPFEDNYFDLITSNNGINNVEDEQQVMQEIARVAKPDAQLIITVNLPETMIEFYKIYENVLRSNGKTDEIEKLNEHIFAKRKPLQYTLDLITRAGFTIKNAYEDSFVWRYLDGTAMFNHFFIKLAFLESWITILPKSDIIPIFSELETELNHYAREHGELCLTIPWVCIDARREKMTKMNKNA